MVDPAPPLAGVHHVKFPVRDVTRSRDWYSRVLGFTTEIEFVEQGRLMGVSLLSPGGALRLGLRQAPERVEAMSGFDPLAMAVTTRQDLEAWVRHLDAQGIEHSPIVSATIGWLVQLDDPDGINLKLYTLERPESS